MESTEKFVPTIPEGKGYCPMITMPMEECNELEACRKSERLKGKSTYLSIVVTLTIITLEYVIRKENYIGWGAMAVFSARELINNWVDAFKYKKAIPFVLSALETIVCVSALLICCLNILFV